MRTHTPTVPRGSLTLMASELTWSRSSHPRDPCCVRVKWWGEAGDGVLLWPASASAAPFSGHGGATSVAYTITCSPPQLGKYLMDMRTLVLDVHPARAGAPTAAAAGHAYLHLALAHFETPFVASLPIYTADEVEIGHVTVTLLVSFGGGGGGAATPQPGSLAASVDGLGVPPVEGAFPHGADEEDAARAGVGGGCVVGGGAARVSMDGSISVASSFALNEKLALFDADLPLLPDSDRTILPHCSAAGAATAEAAGGDAAAQAAQAAQAALVREAASAWPLSVGGGGGRGPATLPPTPETSMAEHEPARGQHPQSQQAQPPAPPPPPPPPQPAAVTAQHPPPSQPKRTQPPRTTSGGGGGGAASDADDAMMAATATLLARAQRLREAMVTSAREACAESRASVSARADAAAAAAAPPPPRLQSRRRRRRWPQGGWRSGPRPPPWAAPPLRTQ